MLMTIAIPTFNRASYLQDTLARLIEQVTQNMVQPIEILVADNASTDDTYEICQKYAYKYSNFVRYIRHKQNIGFDKNLESLFQEALGKYVLIIGDDDYPLEGALRTLLNLLVSDKKAPSLTYSYHHLIDNETGEPVVLQEKFFIRPKDMLDEIINYPTGVEKMRHVDATLNGGLTGTMFLRSAWLECDRNSYIGTNFLHLAVAYQIAARQTICIIYRPLFVVRISKSHRWPKNGELYFGYYKAGRPLIDLYPSDIVAKRRKQDWVLRRAIVSYIASAPNDTNLVRVIRDSLDKNRLSYWMIDLPLLAVPSKVIAFIVAKAKNLQQKKIFYKYGKKTKTISSNSNF